MSSPPDGTAGAPPVVPGYTMQELLGRGGSGEVWRAVPRTGGPAVAVKVLRAGDPRRQAGEAALLGELDHPHLVRLHEVVHQPQRGGAARVALVLDLLPGGSLAGLLARRGRLRPGEVVTAIAPVAAALAHAHEQGVVHGDLSPGNIVFTAEGRPVLTDLGVARVLGEEAAREVTPAYLDPTVARGGAPGPASDVFGIAAAAFHALTGIAPWNGAQPADVLAVAADGDLPELTALAPDAPAELLAVIARGLSADPHQRSSAAAFALDLRHACRPEPIRLPASGDPEADLAATGARRRTELTHQVPGRHRRATPAVVLPPSRRRRWRAVPIRPGRHARSTLLLWAAVGLAGVGLLAAVGSWGRAPVRGAADVDAVSVSVEAGSRPQAGHRMFPTALELRLLLRRARTGPPGRRPPTSAGRRRPRARLRPGGHWSRGCTPGAPRRSRPARRIRSARSTARTRPRSPRTSATSPSCAPRVRCCVASPPKSSASAPWTSKATAHR